jgi:hypothetical protein
MITLDLPSLIEKPVELASDQRVVRGSNRLKERLPGLISVSQPRAMQITHEVVKDDAELSGFIQSNQAQFKFFLVHLYSTFYPTEGEPFEQAWLTIKLARQDGRSEPLPVVWSMRPESLTKNIEISTTVKLGGSLKFMDLGAEAGGDMKKAWNEEKDFLRAYSIDSAPFWEFNALDQAEIRGTYHLTLIVRTENNVAGMGNIQLRATIQRKKLGLIPYRADFPSEAQASILLA